MANYNSFQVTESFTAEVDLNSYQYCFVKSSSVNSGQVHYATTAGASCLGVLLNDPRAGEEAQVLIWGFTKVKANSESAASPLTMHGYIKSGSHAMAIGMANAGASAVSQGIALEALATGSGVYVNAMIFPPTYSG